MIKCADSLACTRSRSEVTITQVFSKVKVRELVATDKPPRYIPVTTPKVTISSARVSQRSVITRGQRVSDAAIFGAHREKPVLTTLSETFLSASLTTSIALKSCPWCFAV